MAKNVRMSFRAQRSRGIWPAIVQVVPLEAGFLHYVMLRSTSVGMTNAALLKKGDTDAKSAD
jgi:hypothetical protein